MTFTTDSDAIANKTFSNCYNLAVRGDADAQYHLALYYEKGIHIAKNYECAFHWMHQSAQQAYPAAQFDLAMYYTYGLGTAPDLKKALSLIYKAADQKYPPAQKHLKLYPKKSCRKTLNQISI